MTKREEQFSGLIFDYKKTKTYTQRCADNTQNPLEKTIMNSIVRSLDESIDYMRTGISPAEYNLTVNAKKKPEIAIADDYLMTIAKTNSDADHEDDKDYTFDRLLIADLLKDLTLKEKECFLMTQQSLFTHSETAEILNISRGTVSKNLERARIKIAKRKSESLLVFAKGWGVED